MADVRIDDADDRCLGRGEALDNGGAQTELAGTMNHADAGLVASSSANRPVPSGELSSTMISSASSPARVVRGEQCRRPAPATGHARCRSGRRRTRVGRAAGSRSRGDHSMSNSSRADRISVSSGRRGDRDRRRRRSRCACCFRPPIRRGTHRWASCGMTRAPGCTTRVTARSMAPGSSRTTHGIRCSSHRSSRCSSTRRLPCSASACGRRGSSPRSQACVSVLLLALGVRRLAGAPAGLIAGALLATNYVYVDVQPRGDDGDDRWSCSWSRRGTATCARRNARLWGGAQRVSAPRWRSSPRPRPRSSCCALGASIALSVPRSSPGPRWVRRPGGRRSERRAGLATLGGLVVGGLVALASFVAPNWAELPVLQLADVA